MNQVSKELKQYALRFDAQTLRERALIAGSMLVAISFIWWSYYYDPQLAQIETRQAENQRLENELRNNRTIVSQIRQRIAGGVNKEQKAQLVRLREELAAVEQRLQVETVELIDPEKMFQLMNQLLYRDSQLKLLNLSRREVKPAIPSNEEDADDPGIYRHVLEIEFSGTFVDILKYMQSLESLDWKLLWDEIDIVSVEHPTVKVKVAISTLSTRKEWVGI